MDVLANILNGDGTDTFSIAETVRPGLLERFGRWLDFVDDGEYNRTPEYDPLIDYSRDR